MPNVPLRPALLWAAGSVGVPATTNVTAAEGNTYKNVYEATTMSSGLWLVVLVNLIVVWLSVLFYRYVILREAGLLSPDEIALLRKYPSVRSAQTYTPQDAYVRSSPPMRWTGWKDFFDARDSTLSRDAQVYLLFQRGCILTTAICALFASALLLPSYWFGGAVFQTEAQNAPHSLLNLLRSDRGVFERFTSHNLPKDSPLVMLQLPVFVVAALCIVVLYTVVKAAVGEERSINQWLRSDRQVSSVTSSQDPVSDSAPQTPIAAGLHSPSVARKSSSMRAHSWTLFARGLPRDFQSAEQLVDLLEAIYPGHVSNVELVCKGRMSEARLLRALSSARNRLDYIYETADDGSANHRLSSETVFGRVFGLFARKNTREELIFQLEAKISSLQSDLDSRKAEPVRDFMGCAFISFRCPTAARSALNDFPIRFYENERHSLFPSVDSARADMLRSNGELSLERPARDVTIGRYSRGASAWRLPRLRNLYRGTVNLLPRVLRERVLESRDLSSSPSYELNYVQEQLLTARLQNGRITAESAISRLRNMKAERAPKSGDIIWDNIGISFFERTVREIMVQGIVFAVLILFTSPVAMLTAMKLIMAEVSLLSDPQIIFGNGAHNASISPSGNGSFPFSNSTVGLSLFPQIDTKGENAAESISQYLMGLLPSALSSNSVFRSALLAYIPVLLLAVVFAIVPSLLRLTCVLEAYPTHSAQEMSVFRKTAFYYLMNAVVLPSLALNTASEFLQMLYTQSGGGAHVYDALPILERLFSGDIAFFLCNYLVQLALTGSVFWLMRLPSSFSMMIRRRMALTPLEAAEAKCTDIFDYPRHYAYSVTVMAMCLLFGFMAPLIWGFALMYYICKHAVDTYLIRYVHPRSHIDGRLPRLSTNFILTWTAISQLSLAVIFYLQGWIRAGIATALLCALTLASCLSVGAHVGNRIMVAIASLRDSAVQWFMRHGPGTEGWLPPPSLQCSSSTSSSTSSLPGSTENDALIVRETDQDGSDLRNDKRALSRGQRRKRMRPAGAVRGEGALGNDIPGLDLGESQGSDLMGDPVTTDSEDIDIDMDVSDESDCDFESDALPGHGYVCVDAEEGRTRRVLAYGTCDARCGAEPRQDV